MLFREKLNIIDGGSRALGDPGNRCALRYIALQPTDLADPVGKDPSSLAAQRKDGDRDAPTTWGILHHRSKCRSEEHTTELQSLMRIPYAVFCCKKTTDRLNKD